MSDPLDADASQGAPLLASQQELLRTTAEHLDVYRATARSQPESLLMSTYHAEGLLYFCGRLIELGCPEEVPRVTQELAAVEGALARRYPAYSWLFAESIARLSDRLREKARPGEALTVMEHALELYREQARHNSYACHLDFTRRLAELGNLLSSASGRPEDALKPLEEAVEFYRAQAQQHPRDFNTGLAECLARLGYLLRELDRPREALKAMTEAAELGGGYSRSDQRLVGSLEALGGLLSERGHPEEALKAAQAVLKLREKLRQEALEDEQEEAYRRAGVPQWFR